jgi:hypothetical protein
MDNGTLTHEQALPMLNEHLGEEVGVWLSMRGPSDEALGPFSVTRRIGTLGHGPLGPSGNDPTALTFRDTFAFMYTIDGEALMLPPLPGTVSETALGLEWRLADGLTLRINWPQRSEGGDA